MENELVTVKTNELIESKIIVCRNQQVMLDSDVAELFGVDVKRLNQQMKRNKKRFPEDFCFQISKTEEKGVLRSHFATANTVSSKRRYDPYAYTEQGILALSGVIKNDFAVEMSIKIVRVFIAMRKFIMQNGDVLLKLAQLQNRQISFEMETNKHFDEIRKMIDKADLPKQVLFFDGQYFNAYEFIDSLVRRANTNIILIDPYCDNRALSFFVNKNKNTIVTICKSIHSKLTNQAIKSFVIQYGEVSILNDDTFHDRFMIIDNEEAYSLGASLNYAGKKTFAVLKIEDKEIINSLIERVNSNDIHNR